MESLGDFHYMQSLYDGYTKVHIDAQQINIKMIGFHLDTKTSFPLYEVTILNQKANQQEMFLA